MNVANNLFFFITIAIIAISIAVFITLTSIRMIRVIGKRVAKKRRKEEDRRHATLHARNIIEKIKFAAHSHAAKYDKDAVKRRMLLIDTIVKQYDLDYIRDLGISKMTLKKHAYIANADKKTAQEMLTLIRQGTFETNKKSPTKKNTQRKSPERNPSSPCKETSSLLDEDSSSTCEIIFEDPCTGIIIMIDHSEWNNDVPLSNQNKVMDPSAWDENIDTDSVIEDFFSTKIIK